ncbi:carbohydrate kinase family protein [Thermococcus peptonophilus]|uniref:Carbohydrate kinase n=1 Tax=Thermococcus peptonophilus TaxID=53952 RepID=A0A142CVE7_9EURY|nr:carbohydrate kinase family protein [Thermococcus peptonophilus]AMQ18749.1 carbohydrate kinase [Thermococcus peptonophilus]
MLDLVVIGHVSIDTLIFPNGRRVTMPGGAAAGVATSAALAGAKVGLVTKIGEDFPKEWLQVLSSVVDIRGIQILPGKTIHIYMIYHEDGSVDAPVEMGVAQKMGEISIPKEYLDAKVFHISPIPPEEQLKLLNRLKGKIVTIDFNPTYKEEYVKRRDLLQEIVSRAEIIFPNEREAIMITGADDVKEAARVLHEWGAKTVVITRGEKGVLIYDGSFREFQALPIEPEEIVDPTGGGDAFAGGFLAGYSRGLPLKECVRLGLERAREVLKKWGNWSITV